MVWIVVVVVGTPSGFASRASALGGGFASRASALGVRIAAAVAALFVFTFDTLQALLIFFHIVVAKEGWTRSYETSNDIVHGVRYDVCGHGLIALTARGTTRCRHRFVPTR